MYIVHITTSTEMLKSTQERTEKSLLALSSFILNFYSVSQKNIPDIFGCNSRKHCRIFIMFGKHVTEKASNQ